VKLDAGVFTARFNMAVVHETIRSELAARRRGTAATKTRGKVSGGGAKPWRQKGTGRARAGSSRSPIWTGGGTVFGPSPRQYTFKINRKERQAALRSALSAHAERESLAVFDATAFDAPSTAQAVHLLNDWDPAEPILIVLSGEEALAGKSFRNVARIVALPVEEVGVADLIGAASLLVSEAALPALTERAATGKSKRGEVEEAEKPAPVAEKQPAAEKKSAASAEKAKAAAAEKDEPAAEAEANVDAAEKTATEEPAAEKATPSTEEPDPAAEEESS
jgi:large subunit ribosomal protein L4